MRPARDFACDFTACPAWSGFAKPSKVHRVECDRLTTATESRDAETVDACAEVADGWCDHGDTCARAIRALAPATGGTTT